MVLQPIDPPPAAPVRPTIIADKKSKLQSNVRKALLSLPAYFKTDTYIDGIDATDLFALNSSLGGTIENQVVITLNLLRKVWDPDDEWQQYCFERRAQSFPDVRLLSQSDANETTILGIELKGWYLLAKESEPSFRYKVTAAACAPLDMLVIVPWRLKNILSGSPVAHTPFIESSLYAAECRNYWWQYVRKAEEGTNKDIRVPDNVGHYPAAKAAINDTPASDGGGNFGRIARLGLPDLTSYLSRALDEKVCGIEASHWILFFMAFTETLDADAVWKVIGPLITKQQKLGEEDGAEVVALLQKIATLLAAKSTD